MNKKKVYKTKYPKEYLQAQIEFGFFVNKYLKNDIRETYKSYTDIYGTLSNHIFAASNKDSWVLRVLKDFELLLEKFSNEDSLNELSKRVYELYLSVPKEEEIIENNLRFGCFRLNTSDYYRAKGEVRLHFIPLKEGLSSTDLSFRVSDLSFIYMPKRRAEFFELVLYLFDNQNEFGNDTVFVSRTWLQNIASYSSLLPEVAVRSEIGNEFQWLWTQFLRWDGSGNAERLAEFSKNLRNSNSSSSVFKSVPLKIIDARVYLSDLFEMYIPEYKKIEYASSEQFDTNLLSQQSADYQLAI